MAGDYGQPDLTRSTAANVALHEFGQTVGFNHAEFANW